MTKPLSYSAFVMNTASHIIHGLWRQPDGNQKEFQDLNGWISLAQRLEEGGFDSLFFADVIGLYGNHGGDWKYHVENGLQIPSNDPLILISALAASTKRIGLAFTASPLQEQPFNFARRLSTLDHLSNGRVGWNIVTGALENGYKNFGYDTLVEHDERYEWAEEYVDVLYKLWEGSWDEGALLKDRVSGRYADSSKVHKIYHESPRYKVEGPHLVAPSKQRTPVLFQAGASVAGRNFAAKNAEAIFIVAPDPENARKLMKETRDEAIANGRAPEDIKFYQGLSFVIGKTEEEARQKEQLLEEQTDYKMLIAHMAGGMGIDLGNVSLDTPLENLHIEGTQSALRWLQESTPGRTPVVRDMIQLRNKSTRLVGTPQSIADQLEKWSEAGVDGINVINAVLPGSYEEFIDELLPVLRERGLARDVQQEQTTLRQRLFETDYVNERHPAAKYRGYFTQRTNNPLEEVKQ